jgi:hypothetical protein
VGVEAENIILGIKIFIGTIFSSGEKRGGSSLTIDGLKLLNVLCRTI